MFHIAMKENETIITTKSINTLINLLDVKLFITKSVSQLINGYDDQLITLGKNFVPNVKINKFSLMAGVINS